VDNFLPISSRFTDITDLGWASASDLVVLGSQQKSTSPQPYDVPISGNQAASSASPRRSPARPSPQLRASRS